MPLSFIFKRPANKPELKGKEAPKPKLPEGEDIVACGSCKKSFFQSDLEDNYFECPKCSTYFRASSRNRIKHITDENSFKELFDDLKSENVLDFPEYSDKLKKAVEQSGEQEAVICGEAKIEGFSACLFIMDPNFMMGSMGTIVGEKITLLFEYAIEKKLPVIGFTVSGGARMQEGILSLMQMAKTSCAIKAHSLRGLLYIAVLCDPTTGGVTASFAMLADIILAEPKALIGFAGPRVIEQTIRQKLPAGFQKSEFLLEKGFIDKIVPRKEQREVVGTLLKIHANGDGK